MVRVIGDLLIDSPSLRLDAKHMSFDVMSSSDIWPLLDFG
jgi:hypothetical protein